MSALKIEVSISLPLYIHVRTKSIVLLKGTLEDRDLRSDDANI